MADAGRKDSDLVVVISNTPLPSAGPNAYSVLVSRSDMSPDAPPALQAVFLYDSPPPPITTLRGEEAAKCLEGIKAMMDSVEADLGPPQEPKASTGASGP